MTSGEPPSGADPLIDRVIDGRYRVRELIAHGGMGSVYLAVDTRLEREVALKVMREDLARDATFVQRFRHEARAAARLSHPHVVGVYDQGDDNGVVFLAMELIPGETLRSRLSAEGALSAGESLEIMRDVLAALAAAHRAGLVHRDVKPENVLISPDGVVKVADFGLARAVSSHTATATGTMLGTVSYLAPEQVEGQRGDERSDVYAAGLVLYEMLTGAKAVDGDLPIHVAYQHVHGTVPAPSLRVPQLPDELDALVGWATQRDPADRPADAQAMLAQLLSSQQALTAEQLAFRAASGPGSAGTPTTAFINQTRVVPLTEPGSAPVAHDDAQPSPPGRRAMSTAAKRGLAAALAVAMLALGSIGYVLLGPPAARTVPKLTGLSEAAAVSALAGQELQAGRVGQFSETIPKGQVIAADLPEGASARRGSTVTLTVSSGPERYPIPNVAGQDVATATNSLAKIKLSVGGTAPAYSETVAVGQVVGVADNPVGTEVKPGQSVTLQVSQGREPIELIDWSGKPLADLKKALADKDITITTTKEEFNTTIAKGSVISQTPAPGTIHRGDTVSVVVSKGPDLVEVPGVQGLSEGAARAKLADAGFEVRVERIAGGLFGTAHSTSPGGGQRAPRGSTITLRVV